MGSSVMPAFLAYVAAFVGILGIFLGWRDGSRKFLYAMIFNTVVFLPLIFWQAGFFR